MRTFAREILRFMQVIERIIDAIMQPIVFVLMASLIGVITLQIVSRVFFSAVSWTEEVARFLLIWLTFFAATLAYQRGRHIAVTFVIDLLPASLRRFGQMLAALVVIGFTLTLVDVGLTYMELQSFQRSASLRIQMTYVYLVIPVTAGIIAWSALVDFFELLLNNHLSPDQHSEHPPS